MGLGKDLVAGVVTETGIGNFIAVVAGSGDTFAVRALTPAGTAYLEDVIRHGTATGIVRVRSPLMHDDVQGIRALLPAGCQFIGGTQYFQQQLQALDVLILESTGTNTNVDVCALGIYYTDIAGISANLVMPGDIAGRIRNIVSVQVACTSSATIGNWADTLINATMDLLHANSQYAVLGYLTDVAVPAVAIRGIDVGNLRCGGPGLLMPDYTQWYFCDMSMNTGRPHIPVINANNKGGTFVSVLGLTASVAVNVSLIMAELTAA